MAKRNGSVITTRVVNGELEFEVAGVGVLRLDPAALSTANRQRALLHGLKQRVTDAAALARDTTTGKSATPQEKFDAMRAIVDHLASGSEEWEIRRAGGGGNNTLLLRAIAQHKGTDTAGVREMVRAAAERRGVKEGEILKALAGAQAIRDIMAQLQAEATGLDADAMLGELGA